MGARDHRGDEEEKGERIEQDEGGLSEYVGFDVQHWDGGPFGLEFRLISRSTKLGLLNLLNFSGKHHFPNIWKTKTT